MLNTSSLQFEYDRSNQFQFPDIALSEGENLLILGESGIGKTTLLHLLGGLLVPKSGSITLDDHTLNEMSTSQLDQFRGRNIGIVFQRPHFVQSISLKENLALVQHLGKRRQDRQWSAAVLDSLGLKDKSGKRPNRLSQGEQQRAAIALAVMNNPKLILADEPTSSLDDKNCEKVIQLLTEQANYTSATLITITHDQRLKSSFQNVLTL